VRSSPKGGSCWWHLHVVRRSVDQVKVRPLILLYPTHIQTCAPIFYNRGFDFRFFFCLAFGFGGGRGVGDIRAHPWLISGLASLVSPLFLFPQRFALITLRSGNLRGGNRKSEVERRVAPPMPACVALPLELMDIGTSVVGVLHLPVREASHCCKSIPIHAIGCRL